MSSSPTFRAIPSIDLLLGKVVRLHQGDFNKRQFYGETPLQVAKELAQSGNRFLHIVDLDGAKAGKPVNLDIIREIIAETGLHVDFGGGIRTIQDVEQVFDTGVVQITVGSLAVKEPEIARGFLDEYGPEAIILGADVKNEHLAIHGWLETSQVHWSEFLDKWTAWGIKWIISTDISKDGALLGPSFDLYKRMQNQFPDLQIIASGGVSSYADISNLAKANLAGVVIGKALHEGIVTGKGLAEFSKHRISR